MDASEVEAQDLHNKRMARLKRECEERAALRAALQPFAAIGLRRDEFPDDPVDCIEGCDLSITPDHVRAARAALAVPEQREKL